MFSQTSIQESVSDKGCTPQGFYQNILDSLADGVYFVDKERKITYWNRGAEVISGYSAQDVLGRPCRDNLLVHTNAEGCQLCLSGCPLLSAFRDRVNQQTDVFLKHRNGHRVPVSISASPILDAEGRLLGRVEVFSDNSSKLAAFEKAFEMEILALIDPLTNAGNRRYTEKVLQDSLNRYHRDGDNFALLFIDLDHFKVVNDPYGHNAGDVVLKAVSRTITDNLRSFDFLGRWGGEEFIAILTHSDKARAKVIAERCCALVRSCAVEWADCTIHPTISIGVAMVKPGESSTELLTRADGYLYQAKHAGRDQFYGP